ncbi:hypothetical protein IGI37_002278 [Enterococcus sp. AZ194]
MEKLQDRLQKKKNNLKLENFNLKTENSCNCNPLYNFFVTSEYLGTIGFLSKSYKVTPSK